MDAVNAEPHFVRVINVGRRFGRGFDRIDSASPLQKVGAWCLAVIVGIPVALILGFIILSLIGIAIVVGLASWLLGRPATRSQAWSMTRPTSAAAPPPTREHVKVVRNERST